MKRSILFAFFILLISSNASLAITDKPSAVLRPGVMAGDGNNETDMFLDMIFPLRGDRERFFFFNPHLRMGTPDSKEMNLGLGYRALVSERYILGLNVFYDRMKSHEDNYYKQWGAGAEVLSKWVDVRANYYKPFGDTKKRAPSVDGYRFASTSLLFVPGYEEALKGYDAEAGFLVPLISRLAETRVYAGVYRYDSDLASDKDDVNGERYRFEIRPNPHVNFNAEVKHDGVRGTDTFTGFYIDVPFSVEDLFSGKNPFTPVEKSASGTRVIGERMTDKIVRDRHVVAYTFGEGEDADAPAEIGEVASSSVDMIYVNKDNPNPGDGTYGNPYQDIMSAATSPIYQPGTWIYTFSSDATADTYTNVALTLLPDMVLWGQGYRLGNLGGGPNPIFDGGGLGDVITLGNNNEVMGLTLQNGGYGIYGNNISTANIHDNVISNNWLSGIYIENYFWGVDISGEIYHRFASNQILNNGDYGIYLSNYTDASGSISNFNSTAVFAENMVSGNGWDGIYAENYFYAWGGDILASSVTHRFSGNAVTGNFGNGVYLYDVSGAGGMDELAANLFMQGDTVTGNDYAGVYLEFWGGGTYTGDLGGGSLGSIGNNSFYGNDVAGWGYYDLLNYTGFSVNAKNNWWGDLDPSDQIDPWGDTVDFTPWLTTAP